MIIEHAVCLKHPHEALLCRITVSSMSVAQLDSLATVTEVTEAGDKAQSRRMNKNITVDTDISEKSKCKHKCKDMISWYRCVNCKRIIFDVKRQINRALIFISSFEWLCEANLLAFDYCGWSYFETELLFWNRSKKVSLYTGVQIHIKNIIHVNSIYFRIGQIDHFCPISRFTLDYAIELSSIVSLSGRAWKPFQTGK